jgi:hypothetical protein
MHSRSAVLIGLAVAAVLGCAWAAAPAIGIATTSGDLRIDRTSVSGNATILEGSLVENGASVSEVRLYEGTGMRLAGDSRGKVFRNRLVLEQGAAQVEARKGYLIDALGFQLQAVPSSTAKVNVTGAGSIEVAAFSGAVQVRNGTGILVAQVFPGKPLAFAIQAGAATAARLTGILTTHNGHYFLTDEIAGVRVEVVGENLGKLVGKHVQITGALDSAAQPAESAQYVVNVMEVKSLGPGAAGAAGGHAATGAATGTAHGAAAGAAAGIGTTTITVAAVAAAAAVGGLAATGLAGSSMSR